MTQAATLLRVEGLEVRFDTGHGVVEAVAGVSLEVRAGECVAVVGESGSGKTQLLLACLGLLAQNGQAAGSARFEGQELVGASDAALNMIRGTGIA
jgi:ABC-type microcin C transport system duplicated ATPase subunit YejF